MEKLAEQVNQRFSLRLSRRQLAALALYERELLEWNTRFNLTAIRNVEEVRTKHFMDSLTCLLVMHDLRTERVIDVGTGAGFPGQRVKRERGR